MFKSIRVQNFQSLRDVTVELAPFTVIVGATDSGKSAFFRALSTLVSNRRGADFVTHGERICTLTAQLDQGQLKLQRGKATADNFYEVTVGEQVDTYTKLSGAVPEEVSAFLRIPAKDPINFASQFDKPYLLDTKEYSSADAARILGALTNVHLLFEGARESNRRKTEAAAKVRTRVADVESITERLKGYEGLAARAEVLDRAEAAAETAAKYGAAVSAIANLLTEVRVADNVIDILGAVVDYDVPDISGIERMLELKKALDKLVAEVATSEEAITQADTQIEAATEKTNQLDETYREVLKREGTCPTCGQTT